MGEKHVEALQEAVSLWMEEETDTLIVSMEGKEVPVHRCAGIRLLQFGTFFLFIVLLINETTTNSLSFTFPIPRLILSVMSPFLSSLLSTCPPHLPPTLFLPSCTFESIATVIRCVYSQVRNFIFHIINKFIIISIVIDILNIS